MVNGKRQSSNKYAVGGRHNYFYYEPQIKSQLQHDEKEKKVIV